MFQKDANGSTGMVGQLARSQSHRKPKVYRENLLEKTGLRYKNEADLDRHTHMVSPRRNKKYLQEVSVINEE